MKSMDGCFSDDYGEARTKFLDAARNAGAEPWSETLAARGPDGAELSTDVAWLGPRDAAHVLVTISATHGVEGFFGSAVQVEWLRRSRAEPLPPGFAALHVHGGCAGTAGRCVVARARRSAVRRGPAYQGGAARSVPYGRTAVAGHGPRPRARGLSRRGARHGPWVSRGCRVSRAAEARRAAPIGAATPAPRRYPRSTAFRELPDRC